MNALNPQTKNTANLPSFLLDQASNSFYFQDGFPVCVQQWIQAIINVFPKD